MMAELAFRNIFRNKARSLITLLTISSGALFLILVGGFFEHILEAVRETYIKNSLGHIRIYQQGFIEKSQLHPYDYLMSPSESFRQSLGALPHVVSVAPRLAFAGLLSNSESTISCMAEGVDPAQDVGAREGVLMESGTGLGTEDGYAVLLGKGLARAIRAQPGESLILLTNTKRGAMNAADVLVKGIFATSSKAFDDHVLRLPLKMAQKLLRTDQVQMWIILLDKTVSTEPVKRAIVSLVEKAKLDYDVKAWFELEEADYILQIGRFNRRIFLVIYFIIVMVVMLSIMNTMNMAVLERIGEIGTMMALGTARDQIMRLFLLEGLILGLIGGLVGCLGGWVAAVTLSKIGIPMPVAPGTTVAWTARISLVPSAFALAFGMAVISSLISSVLPSWKASRLEIAESLRHNV